MPCENEFCSVDESKVKTGGKNLKFIVMAVECALSLERDLGGNLFSDVHDVIDLAMLINLIGRNQESKNMSTFTQLPF